MQAERFFAQSYAEARGKFLAACAAAGLAVRSHAHPLAGRDGEALAMDVARAGPDDARSLLIVSSACHGVEGFCGSGAQGAMLADAALLAQAEERGVALLFVHALNPWGFSWWRRTTHENVDLNRNWHDFSGPLPANPGYDELADALVPAGDAWPDAAADARIARFIAERGERAYQAAVSGGQHAHPQGLFFGGTAPTWSQHTLRAVLAEHGRHAGRIGWIDLHTGLGPSGHGEKIHAGRDDAEAVVRARAWWGEVTSIYDGSSSSARLTGLMWTGVYDECPQAEYTGIALEYGTLPVQDVIAALRADQWLQNHPEAPAAQRAAIKQATRDAFYTDTPEWKAAIVDQALTAARQGIAGLAGR